MSLTRGGDSWRAVLGVVSLSIPGSGKEYMTSKYQQRNILRTLCTSNLPALSRLILTTTLWGRDNFIFILPTRKLKLRKIKQNIHTAYRWQSQDSNSSSAWFWGPSLTALLSCLTQTETKKATVLLVAVTLKVFRLSPFLPLCHKPFHISDWPQNGSAGSGRPLLSSQPRIWIVHWCDPWGKSALEWFHQDGYRSLTHWSRTPADMEQEGRDDKELLREQRTSADSPDLRQRKKPKLGRRNLWFLCSRAAHSHMIWEYGSFLTRPNNNSEYYLNLLDILGQDFSHILSKSWELFVGHIILWSDSGWKKKAYLTKEWQRQQPALHPVLAYKGLPVELWERWGGRE